MARAKLLVNAPTTGRRHGVTFQNYISQPPTAVEAAAAAAAGLTATGVGFVNVHGFHVPVGPVVNTSVFPLMALSEAASVWNSLTAAEQLYWADPTTPATSAYAYFIGQNMLNLTWGIPATKFPVGETYANALGFAGGGCYPGTQDCWLEFLAGGEGIGPTEEIWYYMYVQTSSMQVAYGSGFASNTPGLPGPVPYYKPNGYVYFGKVGPFTINGYYVVDWGSQPSQIFGYIPGPFPVIVPGTGRLGGGYLDLQVWKGLADGTTCANDPNDNAPNPAPLGDGWAQMPQSGIIGPQCPAGAVQPQFYPGTNAWPP